jgi:hypothetical protein
MSLSINYVGKNKSASKDSENLYPLEALVDWRPVETQIISVSGDLSLLWVSINKSQIILRSLQRVSGWTLEAGSFRDNSLPNYSHSSWHRPRLTARQRVLHQYIDNNMNGSNGIHEDGRNPLEAVSCVWDLGLHMKSNDIISPNQRSGVANLYISKHQTLPFTTSWYHNS